MAAVLPLHIRAETRPFLHAHGSIKNELMPRLKAANRCMYAGANFQFPLPDVPFAQSILHPGDTMEKQ